jgi:osmotically-inducible protein OsmY
MMNPRASPFPAALLARILAVIAAAACVTGCIPMAAVGVTHIAVVANDPRTTGVQVDDETIELKVTTTAGERWGGDVHLNVTSYNGNVLLSGEAPTPEIRGEVVKLAKSTERVRNIYDEMVVGPVADLGDRSNDTFITSKVKSRMVENDLVKALYVKVVTERRVVYLMGIVTREEGDAAAKIAATTDGVARVVKLFEYKN